MYYYKLVGSRYYCLWVSECIRVGWLLVGLDGRILASSMWERLRELLIASQPQPNMLLENTTCWAISSRFLPLHKPIKIMLERPCHFIRVTNTFSRNIPLTLVKEPFSNLRNEPPQSSFSTRQSTCIWRLSRSQKGCFSRPFWSHYRVRPDKNKSSLSLMD